MSGKRSEKAAAFAASVAHDLDAVAGIFEALAKSDVGRKNMSAVLGLDIAHKPDLNPTLDGGRPMVALAIPSYKNMHGKMITATNQLVTYSKQFCDLIQSPVIGSCVVHWARNQLISEILKTGKPWTHILFMDDDIVAQPDFLVRMLRHEKDIVGAICTRRTDPPVPNCREFDVESQNYQQWLDCEGILPKAVRGELSPEQALLPKAVGTGMMLISRKVVDRLTEYWINCEFERDVFGAKAEWIAEATVNRRAYYEKNLDAFWFRFLDHPKGAGEYGEDISFCWKASKCGIQPYVDASLIAGHVGEYEYSVVDYLPFREQKLAEAAHAAGLRLTREPQLVITD